MTNKINFFRRPVIVVGFWIIGYFAISFAPLGVDRLIFEVAAIPMGRLLDEFRCIDKPYLTETGYLVVYVAWFLVINSVVILWCMARKKKNGIMGGADDRVRLPPK
jgi:hypothetical protein